MSTTPKSRTFARELTIVVRTRWHVAKHQATAASRSTTAKVRINSRPHWTWVFCSCSFGVL